MRKTSVWSKALSFLLLFAILSAQLIPAHAADRAENENYRAIAYVTVPASENWRWIGTDGPGADDAVSGVDVRYVTNINFAFGMLEAYQFDPEKPGRPLQSGSVASPEAYKDPSDGQYHYKVTLQGWIEEMNSLVDGREYLRALVDLKKQKPTLKVLLSIGGWDSDGFCYMARTAEGRAEFAQSCIDIINEYGLDGVDIDWEYPTNGGWNAIASCQNCVSDARQLLVDLRAAFDKAFPEEHKLLSIASGCSQPWVDASAFAALDYMNVMCYDYAPGSGGDQAGLAAAKGYMASHASMVGDTPENRAKINLGIPFYNEGGASLVPYCKPWSGHIDASPEITEEKMNWVKSEGYGGAFYWAYSMDKFEQDVADANDPEIKILQKTVYETLNGEPENIVPEGVTYQAYDAYWTRSASARLSSPQDYSTLVAQQELAAKYIQPELAGGRAPEDVLKQYQQGNKAEELVTEDGWTFDGGFGGFEDDSTQQINIGSKPEPTSDVTLEKPITVSGPRGNVYCWWKDGTEVGGFGGYANSLTIQTSGRYIYAANTVRWWFNNNDSYTMGKDGAQLYILDVYPNGAVKVTDAAVACTTNSRDITQMDTNYARLEGSGQNYTLTFSANQAGNAGEILGGFGAPEIELTLSGEFDGVLERLNRSADSQYPDIPAKIESTYLYTKGSVPNQWTVINKATGKEDHGEIVLFDPAAQKVTANGSGTVIITASSADGASASVEITSQVVTADGIYLTPDERYGRFYTEDKNLKGSETEKGNWATFAPEGNVTHFTGYVAVSAEEYAASQSFFLSSRQKDSIFGGAGEYYLFVNGQPFFKASSENTLEVKGFTNENSLTIVNDGDSISSYTRYLYMKGCHAHTENVMTALKSLLHPGVNQIDIFACTSDGGAMMKPYLFSVINQGEEIPVTSVSIVPEALTLTVGETGRLTAKIMPANATDTTVVWSSSQPETVSVDQSGIVSAHAVGEAVITAAVGGKSAVVNVTVTPKPVESITIAPAALAMEAGETRTVEVTVMPADAADRSYRVFSNSNPAVAEFDVATNQVTALAPGETEITLQTAAGEKTAVLHVSVTAAKIPVTGVTVSEDKIVLEEGAQAKVTAQVLPADATNRNVTWSSSNTAVATVSNGTITAVKPGTATITVTTQDGGKTAQVEVTVTKIPVTVSINNGAEAVSVADLGTITLQAKVTPEAVPEKSVIWSSSDETAASIDANGKVTAKKPGTVTITATSVYDPEVSDTITLKITKADVTVKITSGTSITMDETLALAAVVSPDVYDKTVTWSVADGTGKATVSGNILTPAAAGTVTVTATSKYDSSKSASAVITITKGNVPVTGVTVSEDKIVLEEGAQAKVTAQVLPADATNRNVTWSSSNTAVATVSNGTITAVKPGTATISVTTQDGGKTAQVEVTVTKIPVTVSINNGAEAVSVVDLQTVALSATINPIRIPDSSLVWSSTDTSIAYVDAHGRVTAKKPGTVTITATSVYDPEASDTITLKVTKADVTVKITSASKVGLKETLELMAEVTPGVYDTSVIWTIEGGTGKAEISGNILTPAAAGTVTVTATSRYDASKSASLTITIEEQAAGITIYAPVYDASRATYPSGAVVYYPADGKYYVYTNAWGIAYTNTGVFPGSGWTEIKTDIAGGIPDSSSAFSFDAGNVVAHNGDYYTPLGNGYWSMWIANGANNAYWNIIPKEFSQYFVSGTTYVPEK